MFTLVFNKKLRNIYITRNFSIQLSEFMITLITDTLVRKYNEIIDSCFKWLSLINTLKPKRIIFTKL